MRILLFTGILLLASLTGYAQKERNVWCFGDSAEFDFSTGAPLSTVVCHLNTSEGCASISDKNTGQLLFYSDGIRVHDRDNNIMPSNTRGLGGNASTTQSAFILPMPGSTHLYYLFCTDAQAGYYDGFGSAGDGGTQYSIIDMNLNSGLGDIAQQPTRLLSPTCEKIAATVMADSLGYWVVIHLWNSNAFYTYPVTASGIGAPVISQAGVEQAGATFQNLEAIGYMRISPDGSKIAIAMHSGLSMLQVFNFNNATGAITGPILSTTTTQGDGPYGLCFSPNSQFLYVTLVEVQSVYQYNLQAPADSGIVIGHTSLTTPWALQTGPDNKIYVALYSSHFLDRIDYPDNPGLGCGYEPNALYLTRGLCELGLPEFPPELVRSCSVAPPLISALADTICHYDSSRLCAPAGYASYQWSPGATGTGECIYASQPGDYYVNVTDSNGCQAQSNLLSISIYPSPSIPIMEQGDTLFTSGWTAYQWNMNGETVEGDTGQFFAATQPGSYSVAVTDTNGCTTISQPVVVTGIDDLHEENRFVNIFPNPFSVASVRLAVSSDLVGSALDIFDDEGRLVFHSVLSTQNSALNLNLASGVYYLRISNRGGSVVRKLVKL